MQTDNNNKEETLISHLEALRKMLIRSILAVVTLTPLGLLSAPKIINLLIKNSLPAEIEKLHYFTPMEVFIIQLKVGVLLGFIIAIPIIVNELKKFIFPALYKQERKFAATLAVSSLILFIIGGILCVFFVLPLMMKFSASFASSNIQATVGLENFINLAISLVLAFGIMFQFPLLVILGIKYDLIEITTIKHLRPYVIVVILFFAAVLTPPDVVSQLILAVPTYFLFELGILIASKIKSL